jgi:hypothetical protein
MFDVGITSICLVSSLSKFVGFCTATKCGLGSERKLASNTLSWPNVRRAFSFGRGKVANHHSLDHSIITLDDHLHRAASPSLTSASESLYTAILRV